MLLSLCHSSNDCPQKADLVNSSDVIRSPRRQELTSVPTSEAPNENRNPPLALLDNHHTRPLEKLNSVVIRSEDREKRQQLTHSEYQKRVDRHGKSFGDIISTKQTQKPPSPEQSRGQQPSYSQANWRAKSRREIPPKYSSPPFVRNRGSHLQASESRYRRPLFPNDNRTLWREKVASPLQRNDEDYHLNEPETPEAITARTPQALPKSSVIPTREEVMEDLNRATLLYLSCPDPTEAAA
ncbi:hypothetical protein Rs2_35571 [Raphanus sativus]|nr:hypothetical protein Rs2_35571 [Raphanus sativus]